MNRGIVPSGYTSSDPIVLTSKNYVIGFVVGASVGALGMHVAMKQKRPNPSPPMDLVPWFSK